MSRVGWACQPRKCKTRRSGCCFDGWACACQSAGGWMEADAQAHISAVQLGAKEAPWLLVQVRSTQVANAAVSCCQGPWAKRCLRWVAC
eukprot:scaffold699_cov385-Prasinococcus_capsulatus_cf.AAC.38